MSRTGEPPDPHPASAPSGPDPAPAGPLPAELTVSGGRPLRGRVRVPGCKGITHRALLLAALADGESRIVGPAPGADVRSTAALVRALGVGVRVDPGGALVVDGPGIDGLSEPEGVVDCANSGSTMRMGAGLVAGRPFLTVLAGDESLSRRPMRRVVDPLRAMGASVDGRADGDRAPLVVRGGRLRSARHELAVASGQVKTALVLAGLQAEGSTEIHEPAPSRDHTERMLAALGGPVERVDDRTLRVGRGRPEPFVMEVPGDPSSAAFLIVAAALVPGSEVVVEAMSLNPGRIAYLDVLRAMGADIEVRPTGDRLGEPVGDVTVTASDLRAAHIAATEAIIDEIPVLAVAAAFADGVTEVTGAAEMAVKESDRIAAVARTLGGFGIAVETSAGGFSVRGGRPRPATVDSGGDHRTAMTDAVSGPAFLGGRPRPVTVDSGGDHRMAMSAAVAALARGGESRITGWRSVAVSYPDFATDVGRLTGSS